MVQLILAGSGGGKTTHVVNLIKDYSSANEKCTLIVPEQYTFTCQKNMLKVIGDEQMANVDVLSFTTLAEKLIGRPAYYERCRLSDSAAAVMMSMALNDVKEDLKLYKKHAGRRSTVNEFLALSSEFKQNAISNESIHSLVSQLDEGLLKTKLNDMALVFDAYDKRTGESHFNPDDLLTELLSVYSLDSYLQDRLVFIDSFRGFTTQEYNIIRHILKCSKSAYITLCSRNLENSNDITDIFAKTKDTAGRIYKIAHEENIEIQKPLLLSDNVSFDRYSCDELKFLEKELYSNLDNSYDGECNNITLCRASDIYLECEYVAARIKKLIREDNYRARDIAVIARDMTTYEAPLRSALKKCGIDVYEDSRKSADVSPVTVIISAALSAISKNFDLESVMRYLKTGLTGLTTEQVCRVENYCYIWKISGKKWATQWTASPDGYGEDRDAEITAKELESLNELRLRIIKPLAALKKALKGGVNGSDAMNALWAFVEKIELSRNVAHLAEKLSDDGETGIKQELQRMWDLLVSLFDELETLVRDEKVTSEKLYEYFEMMLSVQTIGSIPVGLDEVIIGAADRIRISSPAVAFIMGANEGVFPPEASTVSVLTLKERSIMRQHGMELSEGGEWKLADERLIAYSSVCCPKDKLFVTCSCSGAGGEELLPCDFYNRIKHIFTNIKEEDADSLDSLFYIEGKQSAFQQFAKTKPGVLRESLKEYFVTDKEYSGKIVSLQRAAGGRNFKIMDKSIAEQLFGKSMLISPSRVEKYYKCAFSYFCDYGIKAKPRKAAELDALQMGNANHYVMEKLLSDYSREVLTEMSEDELYGIICNLTDEYLDVILSGAEANERFMYLYDKLRSSLFDVAKRLIEEFNHCDFIPVSFELPISPDGEIEPYIPEGGDGSIKMIGKVDRVDIAECDGVRYLRIVDYKSTHKKFRLSDVIHGINMQMLIYLFALWKNGGKKYGNVIPAGVLYYNASSPIVSISAGDSKDEAAKKLGKYEQMSGIILDDIKTINMMEHGGEGKFIPASISPKTGAIKGETINLKALEALKRRTDVLVLQMADMLRSGEIGAVPSTDDKTDNIYKNCSYCEFKAICGFEEGNPVNIYKHLKTDEVKALLEEGDEENGDKLE